MNKVASNDDTQERILSVAHALFHEHGYNAVGVAEICKQAGVVKGSFYHFFPSKGALASTVVERNWKTLQGYLSVMQQDNGTGRELALSLFKMILQGASDMYRTYGKILGCNIGIFADDLAPAAEQVKQTAEESLLAWTGVFTEIISDGQKDGSIDPRISPNATAESLVALAQGMSVMGRTFNDLGMLARIADQAQRLVPEPTH